MLRLKVVTSEGFDESLGKFVEGDYVVLELEHSLASVSKWESKWEIPFLGTDKKTTEQVLDYVRMMFSGTEFPEEIVQYFSKKNYDDINEYINAKMTATTFRETKQSANREIVTSELIYYWMIALGIPFECESWHLNKLLTLIKVCNIKNQKPTKMTKQDMAAEQRRLNDERRQAMRSKG